MAANNGLPEQRYKGMLESLQGQDSEISGLVFYSKFVVAYMLQQDGPNPGWQKANIEGPVYLVSRRSAPRYQLLVKNQFSTNDLLDNLHHAWELDCQKNYVFYKVEDQSKRIRGLWFHDDAERQKLEAALEKVLEELRTKPNEPQMEPGPRAGAPAQHTEAAGNDVDLLYAQFGLTKPGDGAAPGQQQAAAGGQSSAVPAGAVVVTRDSLRTALHGLANDDAFLTAIMNKLKSSAR